MRNWNNINSVTLKKFTGEYWNYTSLGECLSSNKNLVRAKSFGDKPFHVLTEFGGYFTYHIVDDDSGLLVPLWKINEIATVLYLNNYYWWRYGPSYKFRCGPVPHTSNRGRYCWFRRMKTTAEARRALADGNLVRAKRNRRNLPNSYDDVCRHVERNWKRHRKTQYK